MQQPEHKTNDEISINDLGQLIKKIFYEIIYVFYRIFQFYWRHKFIVLLLIGLGFALYLVEKNFRTKRYDSKAIVVQNFDAVDYLYNTVENIENNIGSDAGEQYMRSIFGENYKQVKAIEIEPINDFYNFDAVNVSNRTNFEIFSKSSDVSNNVKDLSESKYFKYQEILITIKDTIGTKKLIDNFFDYLNSNKHFNKYADAFQQHIDQTLKENSESLVSIDSLIDSYIMLNKHGNANLSISNNSELYKLYDQKERLLNQNFYLKTKRVDYEQIIKPVTIEYNIPSEKILPHWLLYPFALVLLYSLVYLMKHLFNTSIRYLGKTPR